ncbi:MAG: beta-glucosidase H [Verrucomicrobiota bacterium]
MAVDVESLIIQLTLAEKVTLCHAAKKFSVAGVERAGIPELTMSDGPHGVRFEVSEDSWYPVNTDEDYATYQPTGTALAATWSRVCARRFGEVLGAEARDRGKDIILGPGINIIRSPLCGRNFEYFSEDPHHTAEMAVPVVQGIQSQDTAACVKHYALNSQEWNRHGVDARPDERTLREIYLPGFEAAVRRGGALSVMGAYNCFRGQHCCENDTLLNQILKGEWQFEGAVISDWNGTYDTYEAARYGLDIEMGTWGPYENYYLADPFLTALQAGEIEEAVVDDKVRRILHLMNEAGMFREDRKSGARNTREHQHTARAVAEEAIVLLKNENALLPLYRDRVRRLLVVGENAVRKHHAGGNSSAVKALYEVSPLEGLRAHAGETMQIEFVQGYPDQGATGQPIPTEWLDVADTGAGARGWTVEFYDNRTFDGEPVEVRTSATAEIDWENELPDALDCHTFSCRFRAIFTATEDGPWTFCLSGTPHAVLVIDDEPVVLQWEDGSPSQATKQLSLEKGRRYALEVKISPHKNASPRPMRLGVERGEISSMTTQLEAELLDKARTADAVLFFGGLNHLYDLEGCDRQDMQLHDGQNDLIAKLVEANPRTVVTLISGSPVEMPWADDVPAIIKMWYAGMEGGNAIARILFGDVNPSGKLPFTLPARLADSPAHFLEDYQGEVCNYREGVFVGYRWFDARRLEPLFPFGHGQSYTSFEYTNLTVLPQTNDGDSRAQVAVTVRNTGKRQGKEVVQLYVSDPECSVPRPPRELKGFLKIDLAPEQEQIVEFELSQRDLSFFHPVTRAWTCEPGKFTVEVGASSRDIRLRQTVNL